MSKMEEKINIVKAIKETKEFEKAYFLEQRPRIISEMEETLTLLNLSEIKLLKRYLTGKEAKIMEKIEYNINNAIKLTKQINIKTSD